MGKIVRYSKETADCKSDIRKAVLLLRFRSVKPSKSSYTYVAYRQIAKALDLRYADVQYICRRALQPPRKLTID